MPSASISNTTAPMTVSPEKDRKPGDPLRWAGSTRGVGWDNLPGETEPVCEPAALHRLDSLQQPVPEEQVIFCAGFRSFQGREAKRWADRSFARAASVSRSFGVAVDCRDSSSRLEIRVISSTASWNAASFAFEGRTIPLIFRTYWSDAARTSSGVAGGSKL